MSTLKARMPDARYPQKSMITFRFFIENGNQPRKQESTTTSISGQSTYQTYFKNTLDWQLAKAESLAG